MFQFDNMPIQNVFSVVISYNNVHEFTNNLLTLYEIKALTRMKSENKRVNIKEEDLGPGGGEKDSAGIRL